MLWLKIYMILVSLSYIFSFVFLFRMRESKIVRRALLSTLLIIFSFSFAVFCWAEYPFLFKGFERYFILVPIVALWVPIMYTPDMAFVFLSPYHWLIEKRKNSQMRQAMEHFWESLGTRTFKASCLKLLSYFIVFILILLIPPAVNLPKGRSYLFVEETFTIPWFMKVISLLYIFSYLSALFLLLIHRRVRRCLSALLYSGLVLPIISFGLYVGKINPLFSNLFVPFPAIEPIYLALLMFFLIFAFAWLDLFFLAFPYLFLLSKVNKKKEDSLEWIYDFPSSLSNLDNANIIYSITTLWILLGSWFVVAYFGRS